MSGSGCSVRPATVPVGEYPGLERVLEMAGRALRERMIRGGPGVEWALHVIGARWAPAGDCSLSLEEAGFYDLSPSAAPFRVARSPLDLVDATRPTPLVGLGIRGLPRVWAKLEWLNPFSLSIKDRTARSLVSQLPGSARGVVEVSSSNTGIALAGLAAALGLRAHIILPEAAPAESELIIRLLGALVERGRSGSTTGLLSVAERISREEGLYWTDQFGNDFNLFAHTRGTGREIVVQLERGAGRRPSTIAVATGTSGTASGVMFVAYNYWFDDPPLVLVAQPARGERIEGIRRVETGAKWLERVGVPFTLVDVSRREALEAIRTVARETGLLPGPSGGAAVAALRKAVEEGLADPGKDAVVVFPDSLLKYPGVIREIMGLEDG